MLESPTTSPPPPATAHGALGTGHSALCTPHSALRSPPSPLRLVAVCLAVSALMQIPLAWAWVLVFHPRSYTENSTLIPAPKGSTSGIAAIKVQNNAYPGARWIHISGWSLGAASSLDIRRSNPGEPFNSNPTYPWAMSDALPAIADPTQWPERGAPPSFPGTNYGITLCQLEAVGWPFLCATGRVDMNPAQTLSTLSGMIYTNSPLLDKFPRDRSVALCYRPIPLGYALNTLFYAAAAIAVILPIGIVRRAFRTRHNRCPTCNYDLHATPDDLPCPECGTPRR